MLPGFRFLLAAIVLVHVNSWCLEARRGRPAARGIMNNSPVTHHCARRPETTFAQPSRGDKAGAGGAAGSSRRPQPKGRTPSIPPAAAAPLPIPLPTSAHYAEPESIVSAPPEPEKIAALTAQGSSPSASPPAPAKAEAPAGVSPAATEVPASGHLRLRPASTRCASGTGQRRGDRYSGRSAEAKVAATAQPAPPANEPASVVSEPTSVPAGTDADPIAAKIATLGGPPAPVETQAPEKARSAEIKAAAIRALEANRDEIRKRQRAERAREHRRLAAARRALQARQAGLAQQQAANPFGQPPAAAAQQQAPNRYTRQSVRQSQAATPTP